MSAPETMRIRVEQVTVWQAAALVALRHAHEETRLLEAECDHLRARLASARDAMSEGLSAQRAAVVAALRAWAEDGGDPWMAHCADRIAAGEHLTRTGDL